MIAPCHDPSPLQAEGVIVLAAAKPGRRKTGAKIYPLHGGNGKKQIGNAALHAFKKRAA